MPVTDLKDPLEARFQAFVRDAAFPCAGAKSALARGQMRIVRARDIRSAWDDLAIHAELSRFSADYARDPRPFHSFAVVFESSGQLDEHAFEKALWDRLQSLADKDAWLGERHDPRVSADPADPHFSLSVGGEAFFVVGLHPGASRPARRFETPALVFNPREQFVQLRADGRYEGLRAKIIERDIALAGVANPMLARHGESSEARQYSGRAVGEDWRCPFAPPTRRAA